MDLIKPYKVYINEKPILIERARVSRFPFNRNWPGYQRALDQTEITGFVSFDVTGEMNIKIECDFDFNEVTVRPLSLNIKPKTEDKVISFTIDKPCQAVVEFDGISGALHLFADPKENYPIPSNDVIYFGPGEHDVGRIDLQSGQTVYIDKGATVYGEVFAIDAENVKILGKGILDHSKQTSFQIDNDFIDPLRPSPIVFRYCKNVEIKGITVRDPFFLAVRPIACENVVIDNIKVIGCWRYNSDGIDLINTRHAKIKNCFVRSFDDSLCLKGFCGPFACEMYHNGKTYDIMEDVVFSNCVVFNEWGKALEVGIDLCASEIKNCRFENCDVIHACGVAMDISNVDYAKVHDITFENIRVEHGITAHRPQIQDNEDSVYEGENSDHLPLLMQCNIFFSEEYSTIKDKHGKIHDVNFKDIKVYSPRMLPSVFSGKDKEYKVSRVNIENLYLNGNKITDMKEANFTVKNYAEEINLK